MDFEAADKQFPFLEPTAIKADLLETFDYEYAGKPATITITIPEHTSVCPYSGLPDFGTVTISYEPDAHCLELRALKYYLLTYRNVGIFYEHLVNRMLEDLVAAVKPRAMTVRGDFTPRGGIATSVEATWPR